MCLRFGRSVGSSFLLRFSLVAFMAFSANSFSVISLSPVPSPVSICKHSILKSCCGSLKTLRKERTTLYCRTQARPLISKDNFCKTCCRSFSILFTQKQTIFPHVAEEMIGLQTNTIMIHLHLLPPTHL